MPQRKAALKRLRTDKKRRSHNLKIKSELKKSINKFQELVSAKKLDEAKTALKELTSKLDKAVKNKIIKKNTASRRKSRFSRMLASIT